MLFDSNIQTFFPLCHDTDLGMRGVFTPHGFACNKKEANDVRLMPMVITLA